jgi:hypothetical protein
MLRRAAQALVLVGALGFFGAFYLPHAGMRLDSVELPTFFETSTIALPDGGRLTGTMPIQRVQRYGVDGSFRNGWFVDAKGGHFAIGLTSDGKVAVCTGRGREIFLFELDGRPVGHQACFRAPRAIPKLLQPSDFPLGEIDLQPAVSAERPRASLVAILLVPFWHPFVSWSLALVGFLVLWLGRHAAQQ